MSARRVNGRGAWAAAVVALALASCRAKVPDAPVVTAVMGDFEKVLTVRGKLQAAETHIVQAEASGKISFMVPEGTVVAAGDPLFGMESEQIERELTSARLDLAVAEAGLEKAVEEARVEEVKNALSLQEKKAQLEHARLQAARGAEELAKKKRQVEAQILPRAEIPAAELAEQQAKLQLSNAEIDLQRLQEEIVSRRQTLELDRRGAQAREEKAQAEAAEHQEYLEKSSAVAPRPGIVVHSRNWRNEPFRVGDEVWRNTPVMELPDLSRMEVTAEVNEVDISQISSGQAARIRVEAFPEVELRGRVAEIAGLAKETKDVEGRDTGVRVFDVTIALGEQDARLRPGMTAIVSVVLDTRQRVLLVPVGAVRRTGGQATVLTRAGKARPVEVAATNAEIAVITSGLEAGDEILLAPLEASAPASGAEGPGEAASEPAIESPEPPAVAAPAGGPAGGPRQPGAGRPGGRRPAGAPRPSSSPPSSGSR